MATDYSRREFLRLGTAAGIGTTVGLGALVSGCSKFPGTQTAFEGAIDGMYVKYHVLDQEHNGYLVIEGMEIFTPDGKTLLKRIVDRDRSGIIGDHVEDSLTIFDPENIEVYTKYQLRMVKKNRVTPRTTAFGIRTYTSNKTIFSGSAPLTEEALKISAQRLNEANDLYQDLKRKIEARLASEMLKDI